MKLILLTTIFVIENFDFLDMSVNQSSIAGIGRGRGIRSNPNSGKYLYF